MSWSVTLYLGCRMSSKLSPVTSLTLTMPTGDVTGYDTWPHALHVAEPETEMAIGAPHALQNFVFRLHVSSDQPWTQIRCFCSV